MKKFDYIVVLQGFYSRGWEDLTAAEDNAKGLKEVRSDLRDYMSNEGGRYRLVHRRVRVSE